MKQYIKKYMLYIIFLQALVATLFSLYASEILHLPPCALCWYQRVFMYSLAIITPLGIYLKDKHLPVYIMALAGVGWVIAFYHSLLYQGIIPEPILPCSVGVPCTLKTALLFGMPIPFLSFVAFSVIIVCVFLYRRYTK